jgi:hypothetical protein
MTEFLWFIAGAASYQLISVLMRIGHSQLLIKAIQLDALSFLGSAVEDVAFIRALKYEIMEESELSSIEINNIKLADEMIYRQWKESCIKNIHNSVPPAVRTAIPFKTWEEAMGILDGFYKKQIQK